MDLVVLRAHLSNNNSSSSNSLRTDRGTRSQTPVRVLVYQGHLHLDQAVLGLAGVLRISILGPAVDQAARVGGLGGLGVLHLRLQQVRVQERVGSKRPRGPTHLQTQAEVLEGRSIIRLRRWVSMRVRRRRRSV